jgi:hypothetical protein
MMIRLSLVTSVATSAMKAGSWIFLLPLKSLWLAAGFALLNFFNNLVQLCFFQGLVAIDGFHRFFNFLEHFSSNSKGANEITDWQHGMFWSGCSGPASANQLIERGGGAQTKVDSHCEHTN